MITIDGHTFDETLLNGGWVIDAGCRGWEFSYQLFHKGNKLYSLDIDNFPKNASHFDVVFKNAALTSISGQTEAYFFGNGTANFIKGINEIPGNSEDRPCETKKIPCITLQDIYSEIGTDIDILKLDIEGAEYEILENIEPIPKQITVEFHEHCHPQKHKEYIDRIMVHLCKYYHCNLYIRDWPHYKYMDCLFIRKDIA